MIKSVQREESSTRVVQMENAERSAEKMCACVIWTSRRTKIIIVLVRMCTNFMNRLHLLMFIVQYSVVFESKFLMPLSAKRFYIEMLQKEFYFPNVSALQCLLWDCHLFWTIYIETAAEIAKIVMLYVSTTIFQLQ